MPYIFHCLFHCYNSRYNSLYNNNSYYNHMYIYSKYTAHTLWICSCHLNDITNIYITLLSAHTDFLHFSIVVSFFCFFFCIDFIACPLHWIFSNRRIMQRIHLKLQWPHSRVVQLHQELHLNHAQPYPVEVTMIQRL